MKPLRILAILLAVLLVTSCNKDEQATGIGDVMIVAKKSGTDTVYGISLYAYTFSTFKSVSAVNSANPDNTYTLTSKKGSFAYETPEDKYTTTHPAAGTYTFSATFENGVQQVFENTLTDDVLPIPTIDRCEYSVAYQRMEIDWQIIPSAASYAVNIFDGTHIVFLSNELKAYNLIDPNTSLPVGAYAVRSMGGGWEAGFTPVSGKTYTVRLFAYRYEPQGGSYHVQCISMADTSVVWGD